MIEARISLWNDLEKDGGIKWLTFITFIRTVTPVKGVIQ